MTSNQEDHLEILDPTIDLTRSMPASRGRLLLAAYLDFLIFSVMWGLFVFVIYFIDPKLANQPWYVRLFIFSLLEVVLLRLNFQSPGAMMLGIRFIKVRSHRAGLDRIWQGRIPLVDLNIKNSESWFTLAVGVYFFLEGSKTLIRWTMWTPPMPVFGVQTGEAATVLLNLALGALEMYIAYEIFRLRFRALLVGIPLFTASIVSIVMSWELWDPWIAEYVTRRRDYQGLPVRPNEIETMQNFMPEFLIVGLSFSLVLLLISTKWLKRRTT